MKTKMQEFGIEKETIIEANLPMITKIEGKDFFFFVDQKESGKSFVVQCPGGTFESIGKQLNSERSS